MRESLGQDQFAYNSIDHRDIWHCHLYFTIAYSRSPIQNRYQDQGAFDQRFFGYGPSQTHNLNFTQIAENNNGAGSVQRATQALASCEPAYFDLIYDQDRMIIAIDDEVQDESCSMAINQWVDGIYTILYCIIPSEGLVTWDGWKNAGSPDV